MELNQAIVLVVLITTISGVVMNIEWTDCYPNKQLEASTFGRIQYTETNHWCFKLYLWDDGNLTYDSYKKKTQELHQIWN